MGTLVKTTLDRAIALKVEGNYPDAIAELRAILRESPDCSEAHHQLGLVFGFTGEFEDSLAELKRAADLDPSSIPIQNDLALTYAMLGMYDEAKAGFEEVLRRDPANEVALKNITFFS
jgi:tetratricopeptide (TPR) repeat protein